MRTFRIDLGSGPRPRGDLGVTLNAKTPMVEVTEGIDEDLAAWGWPPNPGAKRIIGDVEDEAVWKDLRERVRACRCRPRFLLSHVLEHVRNPYGLLERLGRFPPVDVTLVVPNASVSRADWVDPQHRFSWTGGSLMNLVRDFGEVRKMGWFGPAQDLAVQYVPVKAR